MKARIIEIFASVQGEGLWLGRPQVFVRFHGCKLKCTYCDTPLTHLSIKEARIEFPPFSKNFEKHELEFDTHQLTKQVNRFQIPSLALTGGEPLEQVDFLREWLPQIKNEYSILLETSGVEVEAVKKIHEFCSIISMDIKIPSATNEKPLWDVHEKFIQSAGATPLYCKVVYDEKMTLEEKENLSQLIQKYSHLTFIFQPVSPLQKRDMKKVLEIFWEFGKISKQVQLIPQVHKFLGVM